MRPLVVVFVLASVVAILPNVSAQNVASPAYTMRLTTERVVALREARSRRLNYLPGELIVKFRPGVAPSSVQRALFTLRTRPSADRLRWIGQRMAVVPIGDAQAVGAAAQLGAQPEVEYAEPNYLVRVHKAPNDPSYAARQWNLQSIGMAGAWDINDGAPGVIVAVIDTGLTVTSQSYTFKTWNGSSIQNTSMPFAINSDMAASRILTAAARDFAFWTGPVLDFDGHGSHVASTIAESTNNNLSLAGMAYNATILPLKVCVGYWEIQIAWSTAGFSGYVDEDEAGCFTSDVNEAIYYAADNGAKVINMSLGGPDASNSQRDAIAYAVGKGVFVSMSTGNDYEEGNLTNYPASYGSGIGGAMAVGATGRSASRAYYSNTGSHTEIAAPGGSTRDGGSNGVIWQQTLSSASAPFQLLPRFDVYAEVGYQGTSMAAPHVSGVAALLISQGITLPAVIEAVLTKTALDLGTKGRDDDFGFGLIQPRASLRGFGVVR